MFAWIEQNVEQGVYFCVLVPFCPTKENVPFENQRSLASFTRCAAADRFVNSNPVMKCQYWQGQEYDKRYLERE